jgi:hypothetical protein
MDVFNQFKEDPQIEALRESDLYKAVHAESWTVNGDKIVSPIIDMVDAVLGIIKIYNLSK